MFEIFLALSAFCGGYATHLLWPSGRLDRLVQGLVDRLRK